MQSTVGQLPSPDAHTKSRGGKSNAVSSKVKPAKAQSSVKSKKTKKELPVVDNNLDFETIYELAIEYIVSSRRPGVQDS